MPDKALIPFIESAFLYDETRTTLWKRLNSEGIELRCYREVEYVFWASNSNYGEPDLIIVFSSHIHGQDDFLLIIEAKFKSGKSGTDENDQLARYFDAINKDIENFSDASISNFKGKKGYMVYLTEAEAHTDICASSKIIQSRHNGIQDNVFHLRWHQLYKTFEMMYSYYSDNERVITDDLMKYLEKLGLRDFSGITLPSKSLISGFSHNYPIFYQDEEIQDESKTYFSSLPDVGLSYKSFIFFRGN
ncbi:PD-(D/E)XK nuclease family protein [Pelosinus sp. sgz500959]|uniref:PD-(D/E)XK nuclease family protein n=1 Tax=Pelosinus sp. sgz500959 TaxID=3242472 RepID=UPI00366FFCEA